MLRPASHFDMFLYQAKLAAGQELRELEAQALRLVTEGGPVGLADLKQEALDDIHKVALKESMICSSCRYRSGCLRCVVWKCQRYHLKREAQRSGRRMPEEW